MLTRAVLTILFLFVGPYALEAQSKKDSLWAIWSNEKIMASERLSALNDYVHQFYLYSDPDSSIYFIDKYYKLAKDKDLDYDIAQSLKLKGIVYSNIGNYTKSISYYHESINILKNNNQEKGLADLYNNIAVDYDEMGKGNEALKYYFKCLNIDKKYDNKFGIADSYNNLGTFFYDRGNYSQAIEYFNKALRLSEEISHHESSACIMYNMANIYIDMQDFDNAIKYLDQSKALIEKYHLTSCDIYTSSIYAEFYMAKGLFNKAKKLILNEIKIKEEKNAKSELVYNYNIIGELYDKLGDNNQAIKYYSKGRDLSLETGTIKSLANAHLGLSVSYRKLADSTRFLDLPELSKQSYDTSITNAQQALKTANKHNLLKVTQDATYTLYSIYKSLGNLDKALEYHEDYHKIGDSLLTKDNQQEILMQDFKYQYEKKELANKAKRDAEIKKAESKQLVLTVSIISLLIFILVIFNRIQVIQRQKKIIQSTLADLKETQSKLVHSEKMAALGTLTAGIAHEINNPLNFISGGVNALKNIHKNFYIDLIKLKKESSRISKGINELEQKHPINDLNSVVENINTGVERASDIVKGLLVYSHSKNSKLKSANINDILDTALPLLKSKYKSKVVIEKDYDSAIKPINCYPSKLNQVFLNLIDNAIDAVADNGKITLTTRQINNAVSISIKDNGEGIPKDIIDKIFDPFYTTKEVGKGTGLGLSICQGIIDNHNGTIEVISSEGNGTEFLIFLPSNSELV